LESADAVGILLHGRGATADGMVRLFEEFAPEGFGYLAPRALNNTWYPNPFTAPVEMKENWLSSALGVADSAVGTARDAVPVERVALVGFSQGGCLASEYVARNPRRYGGLVSFSGGLIGETVEADSYEGDTEGTPVFLGCSDSDPHIPVERVQATAEVFEKLGADVTERIYEGMGHTVNDDEKKHASEILEVLVE